MITIHMASQGSMIEPALHTVHSILEPVERQCPPVIWAELRSNQVFVGGFVKCKALTCSRHTYVVEPHMSWQAQQCMAVCGEAGKGHNFINLEKEDSTTNKVCLL